MYEDLKQSGIYEIVNRVTGKIYVGSAVDMEHRMYRHFIQLRKRKHCNTILQRAYIKQTTSAVFDFRVLEYCEKVDLIKREQCWMDLLQPEYNICKTAGSSLGRKHTTESLEKMKVVQKIVASNRVAWSKGAIFTDEHRRNISLSHIGKPAWNKGIPRTDAVKMAVSKANKGKNSYRSVPIIQRALNGEFIKEWECAVDACNALGYKRTVYIHDCCKGKSKMSFRFKWEYKDGPAPHKLLLDKEDIDSKYKL